jgi:hypothetical protein
MPESNAITRLTCFEKQYHIYENSYLCDMSVVINSVIVMKVLRKKQ